MIIKVYAPNSPRLQWEVSSLAGHFHVSCFDPDTELVGSGFSLILETAKKKAFAELNERSLASQLSNDREARVAWFLDQDSSGSGFAVGYTESKSILRAILEATERWALSQWIDVGLEMETVFNTQSSPVSREVSGFFKSSSVYKIETPVLVSERLTVVQTAVVLGWTERGVFAGYGTKLNLQEAIDHAYIEALRNFLIFSNQNKRSSFPFNRIWFFAEHKEIAEEIVKTRRRDKWPVPSLQFLRSGQFGDLWLARAIFHGWEPWQFGSEKRFLY